MPKQNATNANSTKPADAPADTSAATVDTPSADQPAPTGDAAANQAAPAPTWTQADVDRAVAKALKDAEKKLADEKERANLSESERMKADLEAAQRENQLLRASSDVIEALKTAGAKTPQLLFNSKRGELEFKDGKLTNLKEIVEDLKAAYPEQFGVEKPTEKIDAGAGSNAAPQGRAEDLKSALRNFYKK